MDRRNVDPYLEETLIIPVGVDLAQLGGNAVVFSQKEHVLAEQHHLLVDTQITCGRRKIQLTFQIQIEGSTSIRNVPARKQKRSLLGRTQFWSGSSVLGGRRSFKPLERKTGLVRIRPPFISRRLRVTSTEVP